MRLPTYDDLLAENAALRAQAVVLRSQMADLTRRLDAALRAGKRKPRRSARGCPSPTRRRPAARPAPPTAVTAIAPCRRPTTSTRFTTPRRPTPTYATFARHLSRYFETWFAFLTTPSVPATNWEVEQAIRPAVVNRKVWGGNRTWCGAYAQGVLTSVLETCRRQARLALDFVSQTLRSFGNPTLPTPGLLATR